MAVEKKPDNSGIDKPQIREELKEPLIKNHANNGNIAIAREVVARYIELGEKYNRGYSKRFMADVLFHENPDKFKDEEHARVFIRMATNAFGDAHRIRKDTAKLDLVKRFALIDEPYEELPNPEPFIIPPQYKKSLIMADLHSKFYDKQATMAAIEYGVKHGCDSVIIDGDFMDFYGQSKFSKSALTLDAFIDEQDWGVDMLRLLQECFGKVFLKKGNHDTRREMLHEEMAARCRDMLGLCSYEDYLSFSGSEVEFIEDYRTVIYGKANIIHGHELDGARGGIHVAYNRLNRAMDNLVSAHSHITQGVGRPDINDNLFASWVIGCLCNLHPRYNPRNVWNHGFARIERDSTGDFEMLNKRMYKGKIRPG